MTAEGLSREQVYVRGASAGVVGRGIETACALLQLWLLTRILAPADFGRFVFAFTIVQILGTLGAAGFERLTIFRLSRSDVPPGVLAGRALAGAVMGWAVLTSTLLALLLWAVAPTIATVVDGPALTPWLRGLAWLIPITAAAGAYAAWHLARQRIGQATIYGRTLPAVASVALLGGVWHAGGGTTGVVLALLVGRASVALLWWLTRPINPLALRRLSRADVRYVVHTAGTSLVHRGLRQTDVLMLMPLAGPTVTAYYAIALRFAWLLRTGHDLLSPIFSSRSGYLLHLGRREEVQREFHVNRVLACVFALALAVPLIVFGPVILEHFAGSSATYPALLLIVGDQIALVTFGMTGVVFMMTGRSGWALGTNLALLAGNVLLNLALIPPLGATGAALATLTSVLLAKGFAGALLRRLEGLIVLDVPMALWLTALLLCLALGAAGVLAGPVVGIVVAAGLASLLLMQRRDLRCVAMTFMPSRREAAT